MKWSNNVQRIDIGRGTVRCICCLQYKPVTLPVTTSRITVIRGYHFVKLLEWVSTCVRGEDKGVFGG